VRWFESWSDDAHGKAFTGVSSDCREWAHRGLGTWCSRKRGRRSRTGSDDFRPSGSTASRSTCPAGNSRSKLPVHRRREAVRKAGLKPCDLRLEINGDAPDGTNANAAAEMPRGSGATRCVKVYSRRLRDRLSSLSHLHKLPVDRAKIDWLVLRSCCFPTVAHRREHPGAARTLQDQSVAEGIEDEVQARSWRRLG